MSALSTWATRWPCTVPWSANGKSCGLSNDQCISTSLLRIQERASPLFFFFYPPYVISANMHAHSLISANLTHYTTCGHLHLFDFFHCTCSEFIRVKLGFFLSLDDDFTRASVNRRACLWRLPLRFAGRSKFDAWKARQIEYLLAPLWTVTPYFCIKVSSKRTIYMWFWMVSFLAGMIVCRWEYLLSVKRSWSCKPTM